MTKPGIHIEGMAETRKMFKHLTAQQQVKLVKSINRTALNRTLIKKLKAANKYYPSKSGRQRKGKPFTLVQDKKQSTIDKRMTGVQGGVSSKYFHYRFLEFGTKARKTRKKKAYRGIMPKRPFITRQIESSIGPITEYFRKEFSKQVKRRLDRLARKVSR